VCYFCFYQEQYTFCHDAILEAIQCGNTQILAHDLRITLPKMEAGDKDTKVTRFDKEFKVGGISCVIEAKIHEDIKDVAVVRSFHRLFVRSFVRLFVRSLLVLPGC